MTGISPSARAIDEACAEGRAALIAYLPVGYPSLAESVDAAKALIDAGVDIIELGLPYSDPVMDGPLIEEAVVASLAGGTRLRDTFSAIEELAPRGVPILVMTYYNPVFSFGVERFAEDLVSAGGAGLITPDLIPDEAEEWIAVSQAHGLDRVFLAAPTSSAERLGAIARASRGFVYATSTMGVTGERAELSARARVLVGRARAEGARRICVGVGVSTPDHARKVASFADGVIVGSAFVRTLRSSGPQARADLSHLASRLREAATST